MPKSIRPPIKPIRQEVEDLKDENVRLREENEFLSKRLKHVDDRAEHLEAQSRRENLVFYGFAEQTGRETWDDCEQKVKTYIKDELNIREDIDIERAHRLKTKSSKI